MEPSADAEAETVRPTTRKEGTSKVRVLFAWRCSIGGRAITIRWRIARGIMVRVETARQESNCSGYPRVGGVEGGGGGVGREDCATGRASPAVTIQGNAFRYVRGKLHVTGTDRGASIGVRHDNGGDQGGLVGEEGGFPAGARLSSAITQM